MQIRLAGPVDSDSIVDGEGIRTVIWTQGCIHNCYGCHNPETHSFTSGILSDTEDVKRILDRLFGQDGITLSGGDPMCQVDACLDIASYAQKKGLTVWCYTGYTFEQLLSMAKTKPNILNLLGQIDILVDGKFVLSEKSLDLKFRGSKNQRILDVASSLKEQRPILYWKYQEVQSSYMAYQHSECVFI